MRALIVIKKIGKSFTEFLCRDWTPAEKILVATCCVLYGMIHGFLISPIKKVYRLAVITAITVITIMAIWMMISCLTTSINPLYPLMKQETVLLISQTVSCLGSYLHRFHFKRGSTPSSNRYPI